LRTFGEGYPKGFVIWAVIPLSHFQGYHSDHFFNSIR
jgi:ketosteroid isomerase-like protein